MADMIETSDTAAEHRDREPPTQGRRQVKVGRVVSNKMDKTVVVAVETTIQHRLYHRYDEEDQEVSRPRRGEPVQRRRRGGDRLQPAAVEDQALARPRDRASGPSKG